MTLKGLKFPILEEENFIYNSDSYSEAILFYTPITFGIFGSLEAVINSEKKAKVYLKLNILGTNLLLRSFLSYNKKYLSKWLIVSSKEL